VFGYKMAQQTLEQPICEVYSDGTKRWFQNGKLHRIDGPAIESPNGTKYWFQNDKRHRIDGPAVERSNGEKHWFQNGERHRIDGPAVEYSDGRKYWYIHGKQVTQQDIMKQSSLILFFII